MSYQSSSAISGSDAVIEELMNEEEDPQQSDVVILDENEQYVESGSSTGEMMVEEAPFMNYERNDAREISRVGMIQASTEGAIPDVLMNERPSAIDDEYEHGPGYIVNESLEEEQAPIDYHTDFEFEHHDSPPSHSNDIISHERLPSSDSFKEEEVNKPLDQYSKMNDSEVFLKHDTGNDDPDRILFFTTQRNLDLLKDSDYWEINCVTKKIPKPFVRCWVIHGFYLGKALPFAFILVRATNESTFERAMKFLPEDVLPKHLMMDYYLKEYKLAQRLFSETKFHYCYFYFTGDVMRKIASSSWIQRYRIDEQFHIDVKAFMMLAFVKPVDVVRYYNVLKETFSGLYPTSLHLTEFYAHMEEKWIGNPDADQAPEIPIELWNVYDSTVHRYPRTNNSFKNWLGRYYDHFRLGYDWDNDRPVTVHEFIDSIKSEQTTNEHTFDQLDMGLDLPQFSKNNEDLLKVVQDYDKYEPMVYLRAASVASVYHRNKNPARKRKSSARNGNASAQRSSAQP